MSELMPFGPCPLCARPLDGKASLPSLSGGTQRAYMCPNCGFYAVPAELSARLMGLPLEQRKRVAALVAKAHTRPYVISEGDLEADLGAVEPAQQEVPARRHIRRGS